MVKEYDSSKLIYDPKRKTFDEPTSEQLDYLVKKYPGISQDDANDPSKEMDNRIAVRILLWRLNIGKLSPGLFSRLVEPYDIGFYKKSDGKSSPFGFMKVMGIQKLFGVKKDIVSVRHDLDYYRGNPNRLKSDLYYLRSQKALDQSSFFSRIEYTALRWFGCPAWNKHKKKRIKDSCYGTDAYIPKLKDTPPLNPAGYGGTG